LSHGSPELEAADTQDEEKDEEQFCAPCKPRKRDGEEAEGQKKKRARTKCKHPDGCEKHAQQGGLCIAHWGTGTKCKYPGGCKKQARQEGFCMEHGGTQVRKKCKHPDGCEKLTQKGDLCQRHFKAELAAQDPVE
jgi:hypothetical protein